MRIGFIGGGFMGEALVGAVLKEGIVEAGDVTVSDIAEARREHLASRYGIAVTAESAEAAGDADLVVLGVKPQEFSAVAAGLRGALTEGQTLLTIMAGVPIARIVDETGHQAVVRVMPNTAAFVGQAMSVWTASDAVSDSGREAAVRLLRSLGREVEVADEKYLDMATALNGSGPGFIFLFLEALIDAGVQIGLQPELAEELAVQTLFGSACLARELDKRPAELRTMVTSRGGTTAAGLQVLEDAGLRGAVIGAVEAAYERAKEL
ncbi:MAG: pyrroline-5-carboxylate reductase [Chloroflexi bacterium]|nr:pyrroline-5-carboxylate reductase [Chloroflexota bacterium]